MNTIIQSAFQPLLTIDYIVKQPENKLFDRKSSKVKPDNGVVRPNGGLHDPGRTYSIITKEEV